MANFGLWTFCARRFSTYYRMQKFGTLSNRYSVMARVFRSGLRAWQWLPSVRNFLSLRFRTASLSTSPMLKLASKSERVDIMFIDRDGDEIKVKGPLGENLLDVAHENGIELEGVRTVQYLL
ncbi:uncharacterized protein LOC134186847 isoform X2 [Corticium candelabrum]|uniref:uncharacterized protein LOC134186847 isoform X2 n=1 Tax=Corticium candelabrum TaxID=121492 RepID=UPI002E25B6DB|nr:uncharacterized protein LOC134186847 isoform X2 [Corticium candelabrum]